MRYFGRGGIEYVNGGYVAPPLVYYSSNTNVYGGGGGLEFDVARGFGLKVEGQVQHWSTPVVSSGTIYPKQVSAGVVYRFGAIGGSLKEALAPILREPQIDQEQVRGSRYRFLVISPTFEGMRHPVRQGLVWDTAEGALGGEELRDVAMIITMAPSEVG